jgi:hypothetical protein
VSHLYPYSTSHFPRQRTSRRYCALPYLCRHRQANRLTLHANAHHVGIVRYPASAVTAKLNYSRFPLNIIHCTPPLHHPTPHRYCSFPPPPPSPPSKTCAPCPATKPWGYGDGIVGFWCCGTPNIGQGCKSMDQCCLTPGTQKKSKVCVSAVHPLCICGCVCVWGGRGGGGGGGTSTSFVSLMQCAHRSRA